MFKRKNQNEDRTYRKKVGNLHEPLFQMNMSHCWSPEASIPD